MEEYVYDTTDAKRLIGVWTPIVPTHRGNLGYWFRPLIRLRAVRRKLERAMVEVDHCIEVQRMRRVACDLFVAEAEVAGYKPLCTKGSHHRPCRILPLASSANLQEHTVVEAYPLA